MELHEHIAVFKNVLTSDECEYYIDYFEKAKRVNQTITRAQLNDGGKTQKDDETFFVHKDWDLLLKFDSPHATAALNALSTCYEEYANTYGVLKDATDKHSAYNMRLQKTSVGGGYHIWHYENSNRTVCNRLVVFMFYLNDVHEGGETEFLYQHKRLKAEAGTLVLWPATYTHPHRGNPPLSNDKYILTGWFEF